MNLTATKQGLLDFDIALMKCFVLSNGMHVLELEGVIKSIAESSGFKPGVFIEKNKPVILGAAFIVLCIEYVRSSPKATRDYNVAEMFVNLTKYASIDTFIWQACLPDKDRVQINFDDAIDKLLQPPKIKK